MRRMLFWIPLCLIVSGALGAAVYSQSGPVDPFVGTWKINLDKTQQFTGQKPSYEVITITVENGVQDYKVEIAEGDGPRRKMGYESKYNEIKWVPYMNYTAGTKNMDIMTIKVDDRTHYRVIRRNDGTAGGIMMRRMAEDGRSYASTDLDVNGKTNYVRVFERQ
jgi:hypothetical protein